MAHELENMLGKKGLGGRGKRVMVGGGRGLPAARCQLRWSVCLAQQLVTRQAGGGGEEGGGGRGGEREKAFDYKMGRAYGFGVVAALTSALGSIMRTQSCRKRGVGGAPHSL